MEKVESKKQESRTEKDKDHEMKELRKTENKRSPERVKVGGMLGMSGETFIPQDQVKTPSLGVSCVK